MVQGRPALGQAGSFRSLTNVWYGNGPLTLVDGRLFSFPGAFGWVEATPDAFLPALALQASPRLAPVATLEATPPATKSWSCCASLTMSAAKLASFMEDRLAASTSREVEQGYILGEIVEGNTRIQVGASYGQSTGNSPRIIGR